MNINITKDTLKDREIQAYVESESKSGIYYEVNLSKNIWTCTCPQNTVMHKTCKHIQAVGEII